MKEYPEIRAKITSKTDVLIRATQPNVNLDEPFYAINWFSTKVEWMYHLYNILAVGSVKKNGGKAFFKAKIAEVILDDNKSRRDLILIIRYPGGQKFKALMESTYFKMVSIFRVLSVTRFTFGFTHKFEADTVSKKSDGLYYAVHHFKCESHVKEIMQKVKLTKPESISIKYSGQVIANLYSQEKNESAVQIPNLMDALVVYQAATEEDLKSYFASEAYHEILNDLPSNYISLLNRIF